MARIRIVPVSDKTVWESFLAKRPEANFLQSWQWGQFHRNLGKSVDNLGFYEGNKLAGVLLTVVEPARRGRYLSVAGGPILDFTEKSLVSAFADGVRETGNRYACAFVRVRPQLPDDAFFRSLFSGLGFLPAQMHLEAETTSQLDLSLPEETLLANMRKTTRHEIRKAKSLGIIVKESQDPADIRAFFQLQTETARRQKFVPFSYPYLYEQFKAFASDGQAFLYSAYKDSSLLAQAFIIFYGPEAVYHYGASTEEGRQYPGAYLIQWEAIRRARQRGQRRYNFWGVVAPDDTGHRFYGVSVFKRGFGGTDVCYLHAQDLILSPARYAANFAVEYIRKRTRRL